MRISTAQTFLQGVNSILNKQAELAKTQQQLATGERIVSPSDDPIAATRILELSSVIKTAEQYQRNADYADTRLKVEEVALEGIGESLQRIRELAVQANNDTVGADGRNAIAKEVRAALDSILQFSNSQDSNGEYIFAGYKTGTTPFSHDGVGGFSYAGDQGQRALQIGPSQQITTADAGDKVFMQVDDGTGGSTSVFNVVYDFIIDLEANNPSSATLTSLDAALDDVLTVRASVGSRQNAIDAQRSMNDAFSFILKENLSSIEDLDYAEAVSRFERESLALQAAQQSFVKIEGLSLFNYL